MSAYDRAAKFLGIETIGERKLVPSQTDGEQAQEDDILSKIDGVLKASELMVASGGVGSVALKGAGEAID